MAADNRLNVTKATSVGSLKSQFHHDYGLHLVIYHGNNQPVENNVKIHELVKGEFKGGELVMGTRCRVGNVEKYFKEAYNIKVQVKYKDKSNDRLMLASNTLTLNQAKKL